MIRFMKRLFDIGFSLFALTVGFPVFLLIALLVKSTSRGPIFYGSKRVGLQKKKIICWKFRTMHPDAEERLKKALENNCALQQEWQKKYKLQKDFRITCIGKFLRKSSLDELPQFWNVLKGNLSVVGPRPVSQEEAELFIAKIGEKVFSVKPGITGLWQTSGRNNMTYEERIKIEELYVDTCSFWLDLFLILKTIPTVFFSKGAS